MSYVLIIGAKSDIAIQLAKEYATNGYDLYLAARDSNSLEGFAKDINIRKGVQIRLKEFDVTQFENHQNFYESLEPKPLGVVYVTGYMTDQKECEKEWIKVLNTINVNFTGAVSILNIVANNMEQRKQGFIVGISSVAGDRGRKSNYIYGSAKAGFSAYLSGLRNRLHESGIKVLTVKPGFVNTKMTAGLELPAILTAKPQEVAKDIYTAQQKGKDILYTKSVWRWIMLTIKLIPEWKFKEMSV